MAERLTRAVRTTDSTSIPLWGDGKVARLLDVLENLGEVQGQLDKVAGDLSNQCHVLICSVEERIGEEAVRQAKKVRANAPTEGVITLAEGTKS